MVEQIDKSPQYQSELQGTKIKSPTQFPRRDMQQKAPLYSSPTQGGGSSSTKKSASKQIGGGIPRSLSTSIRPTSDNLIEQTHTSTRQQEEDSILLRSSRSDLQSNSRSPSPLPCGVKTASAYVIKQSAEKVSDLPMQMNTARTQQSLGQHTNEEPIISASFCANPTSLMPAKQVSFDHVRTSIQRSSDPQEFQEEFLIRNSYNTGAYKHLYSIKPLSGAKPLHLTSSFSSTSGIPYPQQSQHRFNQTGLINSHMKSGSKLTGAQSHRALSTNNDLDRNPLNRSYTGQEDVQKVIEQMQNDFQKQIRKKESDWNTKEALLTQKVEFLEAEVRELKEREAKQKIIHSQMIEAIQKNHHQPSPAKTASKQEPALQERTSGLNDSISQLQMLELEQMYQSQLEQARQETFDLQRDFKQKMQAKEGSVKELQIKIETLQIDHQRKIQELELDKKQLENQIKRISLEKTQLEAQVEHSESLEQQLAQLRQQVEQLEKEKALQAEKLRKQVREHNESQVKLEKQMQERATERVRQIELEAREKEIHISERFEMELNQMNEEHCRQLGCWMEQLEQLQDENESGKARLEDQLRQVLFEKQAEIERSHQLERQLQLLQQNAHKNVNTSQSMFSGTQFLNGGQLNPTTFEHFNLLANDASSIQCTESCQPYDDFQSQEKCEQRNSQTEEVNALRDQVQKLKQKLKTAKQANEEMLEKEKLLHKKHKQQIEHVLMSIFLSDRYIKEGVSVDELENLEKEQMISGKQIREIYQKKINDEIEARLNAETQLQELKHQMQKVKSQAQDQIGEKETRIKQLQTELQQAALEREAIKKDLDKENQAHNANIPACVQSRTEQSEQVFTPQRPSTQKQSTIHHSQLNKQNRPPSQTTLPKQAMKSEVLAPQLLHKTTQSAQVSTLQLKLLKSCQLMVDAASRMECSLCLQLFTTMDFHEHITTENGSVQCQSHVKMMTNLSHQLSIRQQNRSFQNVSSSHNIVNFKNQLNLIKPRESSAGHLSQLRKANNSSSLFFHKQRSSLGASVAASSTSIVQSGVPLPLMFHRTSQTSGPLFHHVSVGPQNITQGFDHTMEESSILQQVPTLNSTTYQQFTQHLSAMQDGPIPLQGKSQMRSQSASGGTPGQAQTQSIFKQATQKLNVQAQKMTRNSLVKSVLQQAKSAEHPKINLPDKLPDSRKSPAMVITENPRQYTKPAQSSQAVMPLMIKPKNSNPLQSFFSHSHHQTQVNWSQKSWNNLNGSKRGPDGDQPAHMSSLPQLPPHPTSINLQRRSKADVSPNEFSNHKRTQSYGRMPEPPQGVTSKRFSPNPKGHVRDSSIKRVYQFSALRTLPDKGCMPQLLSYPPSLPPGTHLDHSIKTSNNIDMNIEMQPELQANHIASCHENHIISVSQDMYTDNQDRFVGKITSQQFDWGTEDALNLDENIDRGMPLQDEQESIRTGSSLQESQGASNVNDQIGNGFFKLNYPQGEDNGTSFKRKQDALLSGKLAASNYFREDSATDAQPHEQEVDSASDWYGSVNNQQNQEMLIAEKQHQMRIEREKVQGNKKVQGYSALLPQKQKVVPRLNLVGQKQDKSVKKGTSRGGQDETKRGANYATQIVPPSQKQSAKKAKNQDKKLEKESLGKTGPVMLNGRLELDNFEQSAQFKLDSFRAYGKSYCTSTKGAGQRYDKNNLLTSQSMNNLDQVLDTQDSRADQQTQEAERPKRPFNKLNLEKVTRIHDKRTDSLTNSASQMNAPRAGRLPTASDEQGADSVNFMRSDASDSLTPDDYVITKEDATQREDDGSATNRMFVANTKPEYTTQLFASQHFALQQIKPINLIQPVPGPVYQGQPKETIANQRPKNVKPKGIVGIRDLNILMNMVAKQEKVSKMPPVPKRQPARINEGSHAVEYFFNETEPDNKKTVRNGNSVPHKSPTLDFKLSERQVQLVPLRKSRFKTQSHEDSALIDSCEEDCDQRVDECDIDSADLEEKEDTKESQFFLNDCDTLKDEQEEPPATSGFGLFMCGAIKEKGAELKSFFKPSTSKVQECYENDGRKRGAQKTFKPSLMANQERKFVNNSQSKSFLGFKLN